ncbi:hypothetical protein Sru01_66570 [Sphaerisporangium rufum]|uniref:CBS domain-containing protein n=1 Tax=Sphaerisporangium rufum TaxID=1381558 RepID=A0A919V8T5_9ACTN|nr:CBS domain-containing protein [Sphaerisporangium rufum]GII81675.1 hypothetical protein Sru01_66570 [Sphaerisporangium rufum]
MQMNVRDVMTADVASVHRDAPFKDVAELLIAREVSAVPVVDDAGRVVGVVSEADLLRKEEFREQYYREGYRPPLRARLRDQVGGPWHERGDRAAGDTAGDLMTSPAFTAKPYTTVVAAARLMHQHGVRRLPVTDDAERPVGMVSRHDLLKVFARSDEEISAEVREDVLRRGLWVDTGAVTVTTRRGVVTLGGRMRRRSEAEIAARLAGRVNGVVGVLNEIGYEEDDTPDWDGR